LRDIDLYLRIKNDAMVSQNLKNAATKSLEEAIKGIEDTSRIFLERENILQTSGLRDVNVLPQDPDVRMREVSISINERFSQSNYASYNHDGKIKSDDFVSVIIDPTNYKKYLLVYDLKGLVLQTYEIGANTLVATTKPNPFNVQFKKYDKSSYENKFLKSGGSSHDGVFVKYYESGSYENLPAVVPFSEKYGWYAAARQNIPIGGNLRTYDDSGRVNNFYICNVGPDGIEEFGYGDDICHQIFTQSPGTYSATIYGLNEQETRILVKDAVDAIAQASMYRQRFPNSKFGDRITINTKIGGSWSLRIGNSASSVPDAQCQDFMSPKECTIIFNLCDPVICPESRCDFGGKYRVDNVIQSGVIGSTLLCYPNYKEKIAVPICLTGINEGIKGWNKLFLKPYAECLQTAVESGETIGICDQIRSIGICEMFWREVIPLGQAGISKGLGKLFGEGVRGGGEYLNIENAFDGFSQSLNYFRQSYGENSYRAFNSRMISKEVFSPICQGFISSSVPKIETFFKALFEPDSPYQFYGWFRETPYNDVTNPPTSHYKVFYSIFAGEDQQAVYSVYLKQNPQENLYGDIIKTRIVENGVIPQGQTITRSKDFVDVAGYTKLCINVNGREECGFKQISTSFAFNYVADEYAQQQILQNNITSEKECVSGNPSWYSAISLNPQSVAENVLSPEIYKRGITRVCATENPGKGTNPKRWKEVGYCYDVGENIKCWLDENSFEEAFKFQYSENQTIKSLSNAFAEAEVKNKQYSSDFQNEFDKIKDIKKLNNEELQTRIVEATNLLQRTYYDYDIVKVYLLRGQIFSELAKRAYNKWKEEQINKLQERIEEKEKMEDKEKKKIYDNYDNLINDYASAEGVSPALIKAVIKKESNFNQYAVSRTGALGLMQFTFDSAKDYPGIFEIVKPCQNKCYCGVQCTLQQAINDCGCDKNDGRLDAVKSIRVGVKEYGRLINYYKERGYRDYEKFAIASYNGGQGVVRKAISDTPNDDKGNWDEVKKRITPELLSNFQDYNNFSYDEKLVKVEEIKSYVDRVIQYKEEYSSHFA